MLAISLKPHICVKNNYDNVIVRYPQPIKTGEKMSLNCFDEQDKNNASFVFGYKQSKLEEECINIVLNFRLSSLLLGH